jgi:hypothetical protein
MKFFDRLKGGGNKSKNRYTRLSKIKKFCTAKEAINRVKRQPAE